MPLAGSGGRSPQQRNAAPAAPQFRGQAVSLLFSFDQRIRIIGGMNFDCVAEAMPANKIESIIHFGPPGPIIYDFSACYGCRDQSWPSFLW